MYDPGSELKPWMGCQLQHLHHMTTLFIWLGFPYHMVMGF